MKYNNLRKRLRELLKSEEYIITPLIYDSISAKIAESVGFKSIGTSGFCMHASILGKPDNGQLAFNEMVESLSKIADSVNIPIIADAEAGYGNAINTIRTIKSFEKAGISGVFIEDQQIPPNCPHLQETKIISVNEMCGKLKAALEAREDPNFLIIARTDAPFEEAIRRAKIYWELGVDMIKLDPMNRNELEEIPKRLKGIPLHVSFDCTEGMNDGLTAHDAGKMGYKVITFPTMALLSSVYGIKKNLQNLYNNGTDWNSRDEMMDFEQFLDFIGSKEFINLEEKYLIKKWGNNVNKWF